MSTETLEPVTDTDEVAADPTATTRVGRLAARLRLSEGQLYTGVIGLTIALATAVAGVPPTLVDRPTTVIVAEPPPAIVADPAPVATPEVTAPQPDPGPATPPQPARPAPRPSIAPPAPPAPAPVPPPPPPPPPAPVPTTPAFGATNTFAAVPTPGAPEGIAVLDDGTVVVATNNQSGRGDDVASRLFHYGAAGQLLATHPIAAAGADASSGLLGLVADGDDVLALAGDPAAVLRIDPTNGRTTTVVTLPDLPTCVSVLFAADCETSPVDRAPLPRGAALDADGALYVTDANQGVIWRVEGTTVALFHQAPEYVSTSQGLWGIALESADSLVFVVQSSLADGEDGALYRLGIDGDSAGARERLATLSADDLATDVVVGASGDLYLALSGADRVAVVAPDGTERTRLPEADGVLSTPIGLALHGRTLLVVNQSPGEPAGASVVRIAVRDERATP